MNHIKIIDGVIVLGDYIKYIALIKPILPIGVKNYLNLPFLFDISSEYCPHDSWLEYVKISENGHGARTEFRNTEINCRFKGSHHSGFFNINYIGVLSYQISIIENNADEDKLPRGDWIIDELSIDENNGIICHEIMFSTSGSWKIFFKDLTYEWEDI